MSAATLDHMQRDHDVREGVLFWGGPAHEQVRALEKWCDVWLVPIQPRLSARKWDAETPPSLAVQSVCYYARRRGIQYDSGLRETWWVYVYGDGEHRLIKNLTGTLRLLEWMCAPFNEWTEGEA